MRSRVVLALLLVIVAASMAVAQTSMPDDRYQGYPLKIVWPSAQPDMAACQAQEYYFPADFHLARYAGRVKTGDVRKQEFPECAWMLTRNGWRWVLRPAGTQVVMDQRGRDLFDKACGNPRPLSFEIRPLEPLPTEPRAQPQPMQPIQPPEEVGPPPSQPRWLPPAFPEERVTPPPHKKKGVCSGVKGKVICIGIPAAIGGAIGWWAHQPGTLPTKIDPGGGRRPG